MNWKHYKICMIDVGCVYDKKEETLDSQYILLKFVYDEGKNRDGYISKTFFYKSFRLFVSFRKI